MVRMATSDMPPERFAVADKDDGAVELVRLAGKLEQTAACAFHVGRLVEHLAIKRQRLVAAEHQPAGMRLAHRHGLGLGKHKRHVLGRCAAAL